MIQVVPIMKKPVLCVMTTALVAVSLYTTPLAGASVQIASDPVANVRTQAVVAIPVQVSKGVQQLVRLVPELSKRYVIFGGEVDGPGVSGVQVIFSKTTVRAEDGKEDKAIFDPETGNLLALNLEPNSLLKPAFPTDQQAKARAQAFVTGLQSPGNTYQPREITRAEGLMTVRMVRKLNNVVLDDQYDALVSFDGTGRLVSFRTFDGRLYDKISLTSLPSPQRVLSAQQALMRFKESHPLELVYLLPEQFERTNSVEASLAYVVKDGIINHPYTGSALDAASGGRLIDLSSSNRRPVQTINIIGTGEKWSAQNDKQAGDLVRILVRKETDKLPLSTFEEKYGDGEERRFFIWGQFAEGTNDQDKKYKIGEFTPGSSKDKRLHILLETDAKTGQMLRLVIKDGNDITIKTDKKRDWKEAESLLKRLVPSGTNQMRMRDVGDETYTLITADPLINGIPVYRMGQWEEQGMYSLQMNSVTGALEELTMDSPSSLIAPARSKAIAEKVAVDQLLKVFPLELTYIHQKNLHTGEISWKLGYDLSFRQTRSHCFCGGEAKVDLTVYLDAVTGKVIVNE
ncbi:hypothetical protein [Brevibacillus sp. NRS-1366]|uniref:hypothetical protein n=1 Tax=Brevibacillus sp. NRS-1366 TaxID=3233899 RepID=UPI003D2605DB